MVKMALWTYGESNPDLLHAMEAFYRYTIGPKRYFGILREDSEKIKSLKRL